MANSLGRLYAIIIVLQFCLSSAAQNGTIIRAENLRHLRSVARINFADFPGELEIGWFEAKADASEFIVFDDAGTIYRVGMSGILESLAYRNNEAQVFSLIDAAYVGDVPFILYVLDDAYFINEQRLSSDRVPVALYAFDDMLFVEAIEDGGAVVFQGFLLEEEPAALRLISRKGLPDAGSDAPAVRIGRIDFPYVFVSNLVGSGLIMYRYPGAFSVENGRQYDLNGGPAVFGAMNVAGSHLAWSDPASARLNLLDLASGENTVVAELGGSYGQYHLLTADASAILVVNLDFSPAVVAWDVETGKRRDLGAYRGCTRIPDKVVLSEDGTALIIGCDTGLDTWRIVNDEKG